MNGYRKENALLQEQVDGYKEENAVLREEVDLLKKQTENLSGLPIEFTEERAVYGKRENDIDYAYFDQYMDETETFEKYKEYCQTEFGEEYDFYLLTPILKMNEILSHPRYYQVVVDGIQEGKPMNPIFYQAMSMYSDVLMDGDVIDPTKDDIDWSIDLRLFMVPIHLEQTGYVQLRFGDNYQRNEDIFADIYFNKYCNIYLNDVCIGTCYYQTNAYVSKTWFETYFNKNLIQL